MVFVATVMTHETSDFHCEKMQNATDQKHIDLDNCRKLVRTYIDLVSEYSN